ncbi:MAG: LiaF domain-containing protein [Bacteroidota bacterium]
MSNTSLDKRTIFGIALLLIGGAFILDNLGVIPYFIADVLFEWYNILILIGLFLIFSRENRESGTILVIIGGVFLILDLDFLHFADAIGFWPVVLIVVGIVLLVKRKTSEHGKIDPGDMDYIDDVAVFGGGDRVVTSQNFKGGKVTAIFGGSEINMTQADLSVNRTNVIDIFAMFGGTSLVVPPDWTVKVELLSIFGGYSNKRSSTIEVIPDSSKVLIIKGFVMFGGGEIKSK